jgi:hypothetical protein
MLPSRNRVERHSPVLASVIVNALNRVVTPYGGLVLAEQLCRSFKLARTIDEHVHVLKQHLPYHESDHILAQALRACRSS